ncbi:hypothetical protein ACLK1Y_16360 [Escherichia coli]
MDGALSDQRRIPRPYASSSVGGTTEWITVGSEQDIKLADLDVILMREDPVRHRILYATSFWSGKRKRTLIVNKPQSLRDCTRSCLPPGLRPDARNAGHPQRSPAESVLGKHGDIIMKPLDGIGSACCSA